LLLHPGEDNSQIMKHIKLFEDFVNKVKYTKLHSVGSITESVHINNLIDTLVNAMEGSYEKSFTKFFKEIGGSSKHAKIVFNDLEKIN
jgi:hypothetical protein